MAIVAAFFVPAEPVLIPEVGRGREVPAARTIGALRRAARSLASSGAESALFLRADADRAVPSIGPAGAIRRDLAHLDAPELDRDEPVDRRLVEDLASVVRPSPRADPPARLPDDLLAAAYYLDPPAVLPKAILTLPFGDLDAAAALGRALVELTVHDERRLAFVAAGNLSARIYPGAPGGYHPDAAAWDRRLIDALARDHRAALTALAPSAEAAGQLCLAQLTALLALLAAGAGSPEISYEHPFGTGYLVASWPLSQT